MKSKIWIRSVAINTYRIEVHYQVEGDIRKCFNLNETPSFCVEYSDVVEKVPQGIAVIPFVCNVLPLVWLTDAELIVPELDRDFYLSVSEFKKGYEEMYPKVTFAGRITVGNIVDYNNHEKSDKKSAVFFSGGVDAMASLLAHIDEKPDLVTIWGADIKLEDEIGWKNVQKHIQKVADEYGLNLLTIRSNFRSFIKPRLGAVSAYWHGSYWGGIQHGIGIIGHIAPYAFVKNLSIVYIGSSYSTEYRLVHPWGSDPRIDNRVRFAGVEVLHDQADCTRQDKIDHIVDHVKKKHVEMTLRVCWISSGGKNCCHCEKCYRTIMGLLAAGAEPQKFGFDIVLSDLVKMKPYLEQKVLFSDGDIVFWKEVQEKFVKNRNHIPLANQLEWIYDYDFDKINYTFPKRILRIYRKCRSIGGRIRYLLLKR